QIFPSVLIDAGDDRLIAFGDSFTGGAVGIEFHNGAWDPSTAAPLGYAMNCDQAPDCQTHIVDVDKTTTGLAITVQAAFGVVIVQTPRVLPPSWGPPPPSSSVTPVNGFAQLSFGSNCPIDLGFGCTPDDLRPLTAAPTPTVPAEVIASG